MKVTKYNNYLIKVIQNTSLHTFYFSILRLDGFLIEDYENKFVFDSEIAALDKAKYIIEKVF